MRRWARRVFDAPLPTDYGFAKESNGDEKKYIYLFSHRRAKPSSPCGRKMIITMNMTPSGIR